MVIKYYVNNSLYQNKNYIDFYGESSSEGSNIYEGSFSNFLLSNFIYHSTWSYYDLNFELEKEIDLGAEPDITAQVYILSVCGTKTNIIDKEYKLIVEKEKSYHWFFEM